MTRPREGPPGRLWRVSCRRCRAGGFHGCGGYPRAAETRVVGVTSIDRGVVPPNRRLPRTNDFFGAVNGIEVGSNDRAALTCIVVLGLRHDQRPRRRHVSSLRLFHIDRRALGPRDAPAGRPGHGHVFFFGPPNGTPLSFLSLRASTDPRDLLPRIPLRALAYLPKGYARPTCAEFGEAFPLHPLRLPRPTKVIVAPEQKETSKRISRTAFHETAGRENRVSATMRIRISVETRSFPFVG